MKQLNGIKYFNESIIIVQSDKHKYSHKKCVKIFKWNYTKTLRLIRRGELVYLKQLQIDILMQFTLLSLTTPMCITLNE